MKHKIFATLIIISYFLCFIFMILAYPEYDNPGKTDRFLPYGIFFGVISPVSIAFTWLLTEIWSKKK